MDTGRLAIAGPKSHWRHSDNFGGKEREYIKSFIHYDYSIGYHTHSFHELNVILSGEGRHFFGQMEYAARPGCVFLIPPHIPHGYINDRALDVYHMLIHRDFMGSCFGEFQHTAGFSLLFETEPYLRAHYREGMFLTLTQDELNALRDDIEAMDACRMLDDADIYINAIAKKVLSQLCMRMVLCRGLEHVRTQPGGGLVSIADCLNYIHQNYDEKLTIAQLADRLNMSRSTFIRQFERTCACSPHQYIQRYRLHKARQLLTDPARSLTEVAQACGFYDASHLRKAMEGEQV